MAHFEKHFTVDEANALLPEVRSLLLRIQGARDRLVVDWEKAVPVLKLARMNGGGKEAGPYLSDLNELNQRMRELMEMGIQLKDLDRGLVDFPAWREDREVFLCWHLGEDAVRFWHDLESGYAGRQPL
jgi:hypothetical protein